MSKERKSLGAEFPHGDLLQTVLPIPFFLIWGLDSFIFQFSTVLANFVSLPFRLLLAGVSLGLAFLLIRLSHRLLFDETRDMPTVLDKGVFLRVRHPMYLGTLLIYMGFILATLSLLSLSLWIGFFCLYDKMATYEEKDLIRMFGKAYLDYQNRVPKWIPLVTSKKQTHERASKHAKNQNQTVG